MLDTLRFITCGSVGDGKSTLIERLLWKSKQVFEDHLSSLEIDSKLFGAHSDDIDPALLLDGVQAEGDQGITIDVAYRFFATPKRRFVVADTPGHEQYTRNMAAGASGSELALLVVNASKGLRAQTYSHARIVALLGIRHLVVAVNKMDMADWSEASFSQIVLELEPLVRDLGLDCFHAIPVSALNGDNIVEHSSSSPWYAGPTLLDLLETIDVSRSQTDLPFRMPVQLVNRPSESFRGYCGRIASGEVKVGDRVRIVPCGTESRIRSIVVGQKELPAAASGDAVTLCLEDEIDIARGSVISSANDPVEQSDQFNAKVICLSDHHLIPGRSYLLLLHTCQAVVTITAIKYRVGVKLGSHMAASFLGLNDIGVVNISTDRPIAFESCDRCRRLGSFILVDRLSNETVGAGMIDFSLRRAANVHWQALDVDKRARARQKLQRPICLWFTGLPGSGKSTIANLLEKRLFAAGRHTYILDGDNIRHGLNRDLGFSEADRVENIRRVTEVAKLLVDAGLVVIASFISPYRAERDFARSLFLPGEFYEIFVDTSLEECERRDPKGLYAKARRGELANFTGIDSAYDPPASPEIHLNTADSSPEECVNQILLAVVEARFAESTGDTGAA